MFCFIFVLEEQKKTSMAGLQPGRKTLQRSSGHVECYEKTQDISMLGPVGTQVQRCIRVNNIVARCYQIDFAGKCYRLQRSIAFRYLLKYCTSQSIDEYYTDKW